MFDIRMVPWLYLDVVALDSCRQTAALQTMQTLADRGAPVETDMTKHIPLFTQISCTKTN